MFAAQLPDNVVNITKLIHRLETASEPSRWFDRHIAFHAGWIESIERASGTTEKVQASWISPRGAKISRPPFYTYSVQAAYDLSQDVCPTAPLAFTWDESGATAVIDGQVPAYSEFPAIALCIAVVRYLDSFR